MITAVRLRLLPAPEAAIPLVVFLRTRGGLRGDPRRVRRGDPAVGARLPRRRHARDRRGRIPGGRARRGRVRAARRGRRHARAGRGSARGARGGARRARRSRSRSRPTARRCGAGGTASTAWSRRCAGRRSARTWRSPSSAWRRGSSGSRRSPRATGCARARGGTGATGTCTPRCWWTPPSEAELDAAEAVGEELFALAISLGGSIAAEHGVGWLKRGLLASQWDARAVELHEQIKRVRPQGACFNPGKKLARYARASNELRGWGDGARQRARAPRVRLHRPVAARGALPRGDGASCARTAGSRRGRSATSCSTASRPSSSCARARRSSRG